jgi:hypothetical protein
MSELRDLVIDAHGGIERWNNVKAIGGNMSITGLLWARKSFDGIKIWTKRRALRRNPDGTTAPAPVIVAIEIENIRLS